MVRVVHVVAVAVRALSDSALSSRCGRGLRLGGGDWRKKNERAVGDNINSSRPPCSAACTGRLETHVGFMRTHGVRAIIM